MLRLTAPNTNHGFTLTENLIILVILGILTALTAPSIVGVYNRQQLNYSVNLVRGALQEAQREAMREGKQCEVVLSATNITSPDGCLLSDRQMPGVVTMEDNSEINIKFGIRGNFEKDNGKDADDELVVVLSAENVNEKQCVVVGYPLGIIRTGIYEKNQDITFDDCIKKP